MTLRRKVYAYIVQGDDLVVFREPDFPEAGIQVPGGTVEEGKSLEDAVLREAFEETGLRGLQIVRYLGMHQRDMRDIGKDEIHERHFYLLGCDAPIPARWFHAEQHPSDGGQAPITFELYRVPLANPPTLIADLDVFLRDV